MIPTERQLFELQDSGTKVLVTTDDLAQKLSADGRTVVRLDADWPEIARESHTNPEPAASLANPAYVIYTSGSTGKPKGVIVYALRAAELPFLGDKSIREGGAAFGPGPFLNRFRLDHHGTLHSADGRRTSRVAAGRCECGGGRRGAAAARRPAAW